ncbi:MAG: hypothetical protein FWF56_01330 [Firmicutes bacterium]|nr:hypothetical protein [Bacillota bacterium]MCL1953607.1 hypothetical protein [Bacillota bacterium]
MLCQNCNQKKATYHSLKNINGQVTEIYLCSDCRKILHDNMGISNVAANFGILGSLQGLSDFLGSFINSGKQEVIPTNTLSCNHCGTTYSEFRKTLYVGCQHCYQSFGKIIMPMLGGIQNGTTHTGKVPKGMEHMQEYQTLELQIARAKAEERYEDAIVLRDKLRALKQKDSRI